MKKNSRLQIIIDWLEKHEQGIYWEIEGSPSPNYYNKIAQELLEELENNI